MTILAGERQAAPAGEFVRPDVSKSMPVSQSLPNLDARFPDMGDGLGMQRHDLEGRVEYMEECIVTIHRLLHESCLDPLADLSDRTKRLEADVQGSKKACEQILDATMQAQASPELAELRATLDGLVTTQGAELTDFRATLEGLAQQLDHGLADGQQELRRQAERTEATLQSLCNRVDASLLQNSAEMRVLLSASRTGCRPPSAEQEQVRHAPVAMASPSMMGRRSRQDVGGPQFPVGSPGRRRADVLHQQPVPSNPVPVTVERVASKPRAQSLPAREEPFAAQWGHSRADAALVGPMGLPPSLPQPDILDCGPSDSNVQRSWRLQWHH